ncbi:MAG: hypothetical protein JNG88_10380 [Phycisphaerales bacterium]|nr:hypothetical protein [Phycisphaerales bacterium]
MTILAIVAAAAARADFMSDLSADHRASSVAHSPVVTSNEFATSAGTLPPIEHIELEDVFASPRPQPRMSDSAAVLIFGLGGVGVWQAGRNAKKFASSITPDWYHTGGPTQVGHSTPLPLDWTETLSIDVAFETPMVVVPHVSYRLPLEAAATLLEPAYARILAPRAPPFASM